MMNDFSRLQQMVETRKETPPEGILFSTHDYARKRVREAEIDATGWVLILYSRPWETVALNERGRWMTDIHIRPDPATLTASRG
jgi:hypothetical protein